MEFEFIKPKHKSASKTTWMISDYTKAIVKHYAQYTGYSEDEVVDTFLKKILDDPEFINWIKSKRRNKRLMELFKIPMEENVVGKTKTTS